MSLTSILRGLKIQIFIDMLSSSLWYEGWKFNSGNYLFTTDTKQIHIK